MSDFEAQCKQRQAKAEERAAALTRALMRAGRQEDLFRAAEDTDYRDQLYREFRIP